MSVYEKKYHRISLGHKNNALVLLIAICMILFVSLAFLKAMMYLRYGGDGQLVAQNFRSDILTWFALPASFPALLSKPWTILTHAFVHDGLMSLIGNMLWLWFFGYIMQDLTGNRKIFPVFLYGMLVGAFVYILSYNIFPALIPQRNYVMNLGASSGVMAIAMAVTTIAPGFRLLPMLNGGIPIWILTVVYLVIDFVSIPLGDTGGHIAHLAGGLTGFLFIFFLRRGYDGSEWINQFFDWVNNLFNPDKPKKGKSIKEELFYKAVADPYKRTPNVTQKRIDDILDKITQRGYEELTEEEKELLKRASNEDL